MIRPRRSVLYLPASNDRAMVKARTLDCDAVILDLEDAVAPESKLEARANALAAASAGGFGHRELIVRVNALNTNWGEDDLLAVASAGFDAILVPKICSAADVHQYRLRLPAHAATATPLWAMVETARSVLALDAIAASAAEHALTCFVVGTNDLARELRMQLDTERAAIAPFLAMTVAAARGYGLQVLDGVFNDLEDVAGFDDQCRQGVAFGFDGKTLIHPRQVAPCNAAFAPSEQQIARARRVIEAFAAPANATRGALRVDGAMVERLHLQQAEQVIATAELIARRRASDNK